jgi:hypothetical protein
LLLSRPALALAVMCCACHPRLADRRAEGVSSPRSFPAAYARCGEGNRVCSGWLTTRWLAGLLLYQLTVTPDTALLLEPPQARISLYDASGFLLASFETKLFPHHNDRGQVDRMSVAGRVACPDAASPVSGQCSKAMYAEAQTWDLEFSQPGALFEH